MVYWFILAVIVGVTVADAILRILKRKKAPDRGTGGDSRPLSTRFLKGV